MPRTAFARPGIRLLLLYALLGAGAIALDGLLHALDLVWVGRWLGPFGTGLILVSFVYSLRKREILRRGSPRVLLRVHEALAWTGALALLVHGGVHFHALLPWLALAAMLVAVASGLAGEYLLSHARSQLFDREQSLREAGHRESEIARRLHAEATAVQALATWRIVHLPIALNFGVLSVVHVLTIAMFW